MTSRPVLSYRKSCSPIFLSQAEFLYKVKPKLPNQFKAADVNGVPFAIVLGEDELSQGKVKIKEMGLQEGHPEKEGVLVNISDLVDEVKSRIKRKAELEALAVQAEGLRVVGGVKGEPSPEGKAGEEQPVTAAAEAKDVAMGEGEAEHPKSMETIRAS
jgi:histidyl-tRNA synthetase